MNYLDAITDEVISARHLPSQPSSPGASHVRTCKSLPGIQIAVKTATTNRIIVIQVILVCDGFAIQLLTSNI
jgi:hypothetical protein